MQKIHKCNRLLDVASGVRLHPLHLAAHQGMLGSDPRYGAWHRIRAAGPSQGSEASLRGEFPLPRGPRG
jgi:hypothetical protein